MKTFNRAKLLRLVKARIVTCTRSYSFDDQYGTSPGIAHEMAVRIMPDDRTNVREGTVYVYESDFAGNKAGRAREAGTDTQGRLLVHLRVHSNLNFTFAINDKPVISTDELAEKFAGTVPEFQAEIHNIAFAGGLPYLEVYKRWRQYAAAQYDQSPLLSEFKENHAVTLGLKKKVVIEDDKGNSETFTVTRQESEGFEAYLQKHITIPALALARLYFHYTKQGLDLMKLPLPADIARLAKPSNILPFVTA